MTLTLARVAPVPIDVVWQIIEPAETMAAWFALAERSGLLHGEGLGRHQRLHVKWGRTPGEIDYRVAEYAPEHRLVWSQVAERIGGRAAPAVADDIRLMVELTQVSTGTKISITAQNLPAGMVRSLPQRLLAARRMRAVLAESLRRLAASAD